MAAEREFPAPHDVAGAFVAQYFNVLQHSPEETCKMYVEDSVVSRQGPDGKMISFKSIEAIKEQILSSDFKSATFEILSTDAQKSCENGIFVVVIGFLTGKDKAQRKFSQSFYLACQQNVYVVLNDIMRYVDDNSSVLGAEEAKETASMAALTQVPEPAHTPSQPTPERAVESSVESSENAEEINRKIEMAEENAKDINGKIELAEENGVKSEESAQPVPEAIASKALPETTKRSFASIVQSLAQNSAPFHVKAPTFDPKHWEKQNAFAAPKPSAPAVDSKKKINPKNIDEPGKSIFVANLPMTATPAQVHEVFKSFGPIKADGIQVRSYKLRGVCFGFVAFESASSVQNVLQASAFVLDGRKLSVKEKLASYDGGKTSTRKGGFKKQNGDGYNRDRGYGRNGREKRGDRLNREGNQKVDQNDAEKAAPQARR